MNVALIKQYYQLIRYICFNTSMQVNDFVCISDNAYVREQVLVMEKTILRNLDWYLTVPTPYVFLVRYIKASIPSDKEVYFFILVVKLFKYQLVQCLI